MSMTPAESEYAVALSLAALISATASEHQDHKPQHRDDFRSYYLDLYAECLDAVQGRRGERAGDLLPTRELRSVRSN